MLHARFIWGFYHDWARISFSPNTPSYKRLLYNYKYCTVTFQDFHNEGVWWDHPQAAAHPGVIKHDNKCGEANLGDNDIFQEKTLKEEQHKFQFVDFKQTCYILTLSMKTGKIQSIECHS